MKTRGSYKNKLIAKLHTNFGNKAQNAPQISCLGVESRVNMCASAYFCQLLVVGGSGEKQAESSRGLKLLVSFFVIKSLFKKLLELFRSFRSFFKVAKIKTPCSECAHKKIENLKCV